MASEIPEYAEKFGYRITEYTMHYFNGSGRGPAFLHVAGRKVFLKPVLQKWFLTKQGMKFFVGAAAPASPTAAPEAPALPTVAATAQTPPAPAKRAKAKAVQP